MYKNIISIVILTLISFNLHGQDLDCGINHRVKQYHLSGDVVNYRISTGLCYHYNSSTLDMGYGSHYLSLTFMNPNTHRSTPNMREEIYLGYTYDRQITRSINAGVSPYIEIRTYEPVLRFYIDKKVYKVFYLHGSTIQVGDRMNHLIGGIKVKL